MAKTKDRKTNTYGKIAAIQTLLENYPTLTASDPLLTNVSLNTSVGFLLDILNLLGITKNDLISWVSNLLAGDNDGNGGILNVIEYSVKGILLANIKNVFTCTVDPLLPDSLMRYTNPKFPDGTRPDPYSTYTGSDAKKIEIDLNQIDLFGLLNSCPVSEDGSVFYFDSYNSIYGTDDSKKISTKGTYNSLKKLETAVESGLTDGIYAVSSAGMDRYYNVTDNTITRFIPLPEYTPSDLWKSCDFNAYLWYIINKGTTSNLEDLQYSAWDNRVKYIKEMKDDSTLRTNFFDITKCTVDEASELKSIPISGKDQTVDKKQIIICEFEERPNPGNTIPTSNILRVWINANRYYKTNKIKIGDKKRVSLNKTIFEFNYDYIDSLKLFDSKTLVAGIVNALLGLSPSISASMTIEQKKIAEEVKAIANKVIASDDQSTTDCYYTFSNDEYDKMLREVERSVGTFGLGDEIIPINSASVVDSLLTFGQSSTLNVKSSTIEGLLQEIDATLTTPGDVRDEIKFSVGFGFIQDFIQQIVTQIVLQVLTPKVGILFMINGIVMGTPVDDIKSWKDFIKNFQNVIFAIIKQVKDLIVDELFKFVMDKLKIIINLVITKIALETVQYYKDLISQLVLDCIPNIDISFGRRDTTIDNVNYADIVKEATPTETHNKQC